MISAPRQLVRQGLIHNFGRALAIVLATAFATALGIVSTAEAVVSVLAAGLAAGLMIGFVPEPSPWPRYLVAILILRCRNELPLHPARFLDWAYTAGLMRMSGIAVQFRHDTLRAWLIHHDTIASKGTTHTESAK